MTSRTISIVTPTFNSEKFLDSTIASVVDQEPGDFSLTVCYHIQDGGSSDSTLNIVQKWQSSIAARANSTNLILTFSSGADRGMYDAINKGFSHLNVGQSDLMTWINSDDLLAPGAFSAALSVVGDVPEVSWLGGRTSLVNESGAITRLNQPTTYVTHTLRAGKYDGREMQPFLQQEGTFWRPWLWNTSGGLDPNFKLAGDWDLWRRFAEYADYTTVDSVFGFHRRRIGQLSGDISAYYAEVDSHLSQQRSAIVSTSRRAPEHVNYDNARKCWVETPISKTVKKKRRSKLANFRRLMQSYALGRWIKKINRQRLERRRIKK